MRRIVVSLEGEEFSALHDWAQQERREPRDQAAVIIRAELMRLGLLKDTTVTQAQEMPSSCLLIAS